MVNYIDVVIFPNDNMSNYPSAIKEQAEHTDLLTMRTKVFPAFIKDQADHQLDDGDLQQTIKELNYGENLRVKNALYSMVDRYLRTFMLSEGSPQHTEDPLTQSLRQLMPGYELSIENHTYSKQTNNEQLIDIYTHKLSVAEIVRVNIDRPWTIDKTYQAERIEYLDYPVINKELNYHSKER